jgi:hypothetical protein
MAEFSFKAVTLSDDQQEPLFVERFMPGSEITVVARASFADAITTLDAHKPDMILIEGLPGKVWVDLCDFRAAAAYR